MDTLTEIMDLQHPIWQGLILAMLVGMTLTLITSPLRQVYSFWRIQKLIKQLGQARLRNVYLPDGMDGNIFIEHLVLTPVGLLLLNLKHYRGNIFAAEKIDQWTQVVGHHSYKFSNPLYQLESDLQGIRAIIPKTQVNGLVVFAADCRFPKGKPERVYDYQELVDMAKSSRGENVSDQMQQVWNKMLEQVSDASEMSEPVIYKKGDKKRLVLGMLFFVLSLVYLFWYLGLLRFDI